METSNVLTDKWEFKGISIIKTPYQEFRIKPFAKDGKDMGKLIVTAVNACKAINPNNPIKVAEVLPELFLLMQSIADNLKERKGTDNELKLLPVEAVRLLSLLKQATE